MNDVSVEEGVSGERRGEEEGAKERRVVRVEEGGGGREERGVKTRGNKDEVVVMTID